MYNETILNVNSLNKSYKTRNILTPVLYDVSFSVQKKEFVAIMGPSGSGKTTLLNIISGFLKADSGTVFLSNEDILKISDEKMSEIRQHKIGFVFQDFMLVDGLT